MKKLFSLKNWTIIGIAAVLMFVTAFSAQPAKASSDFNLEVAHLINGNKLGVDRELPVNVFVNGQLAIPDFRFGDKIEKSMSAGWYTIEVFLTDGTPLPAPMPGMIVSFEKGIGDAVNQGETVGSFFPGIKRSEPQASEPSGEGTPHGRRPSALQTSRPR